MDTKQQIKKYKIQLHELQNALKMAIERETHIFDAEQHRIVYKTQEFKEECNTKSNMIKEKQLQLLEKLAEYTAELEKINAELADLQGHKFKLRFEILNKIHAENRAKKDVRRNRDIFNKQLADIKQQISNHTIFINNYETMRRQINEDYYNWKAERDETHTRIETMVDGAKKKEILQKYLDELEYDSRSNPENRYDKLDNDIAYTKRDIEHLDYQYNKLENYVKTFTESSTTQHDLAISSYLRDTNARIPVLKLNRHEINTKITDTRAKINNFGVQLSEIVNAPIPKELEEQSARAHQRLEISGQRAHSEYDQLITALNEKIQTLDNQLATELETNLIPLGTQIMDIPLVHATSSISQVVDITGKSRKEIERLKKHQMLKQIHNLQSTISN